MNDLDILKIKKICDNMKIYNKKDIPKRIQECKELLKNKTECLCSLAPIAKKVSPDLLHFVLSKCKNNCKLCKYKNTKDLIKYAKELEYHSLVKLIPVRYICENAMLLEHVVYGHIHDIPNCDVDQISSLSKIRVSSSTILRLFGAGTSGSHKILSHWILDPFVIEDHYIDLFDYVLCCYADGFTTIFTKEQLTPLFQYKPEEMFSAALADAYDTKKYELVELMLEIYATVNIPFSSIHCINYLPPRLKGQILSKISNIFELSSIKYRKFVHNVRRTSDIFIFPSDIMMSIFVLNGSYVSLVGKLLSSRPLYIVYEDEYGNEMGVDEGGLTRDFYTTLSQQISGSFHDVDGYMMPTKKVRSQAEWYMLGILVARSILFENISPSIELHPFVSYLMVFGNENINIEHLISCLSAYNIEYIEYLAKVLTMTTEEYEQFLYLQGEDETPLPSPQIYILNCLISKYVYPAIKEFVTGFRTFLENSRFLKVNLEFSIFHTYLTGVKQYNISKKNRFSLAHNLKVFYSDTENEKLATVTEIFKTVLVEVLEDLNVNNVEKLKAFLKFWYGTSSIQNFETKVATVQFLRNDELYGCECFESSTCFYKLYVYQKIALKYYRNRKTLYGEIVNMIDRTLSNQELVESAGMHMQQS